MLMVETDLWTGIMLFKKRTYDNGEFDYESMAELYTEMRDYMVSWLRAINDNSPYWNQKKPYNQASCRDERSLQVIRTANVSQHYPHTLPWSRQSRTN